MFKKLALTAVIALSSFAAVPAAMAEPDCAPLSDGIVCIDTSYRSGWDIHDIVGFSTTSHEWIGTVSCRDNPTTYSWQVETEKGYAPDYLLEKVATSWCERRLY